MNTATPGWVWPWRMTGVVEMPVKTQGWYQEAFINPLCLTSAHTDVEYIQTRISRLLCRYFSRSLYRATTSSWGVITQMPRLLWLVRTRTADITFIHVIPHQLLETKAKHIWRFETTKRGNCWTSTMCASISSQWQQFSIPSSFPAFHFIPIFHTDLLFPFFLLSRNFLLHWPSRIFQTEGLNDELSREKQVFLWFYIWALYFLKSRNVALGGVPGNNPSDTSRISVFYFSFFFFFVFLMFKRCLRRNIRKKEIITMQYRVPRCIMNCSTINSSCGDLWWKLIHGKAANKISSARFQVLRGRTAMRDMTDRGRGCHFINA